MNFVALVQVFCQVALDRFPRRAALCGWLLLSQGKIPHEFGDFLFIGDSMEQRPGSRRCVLSSKEIFVKGWNTR